MEEELKNIHDYIIVLKRRKWSLVLPTIIIFCIALIVALLLPPVYRSTSTILIEEQELPREFVANTVTGYAEQRLQMINQRIMSSTRLLEIVNRFNLYANYRKTWTTDEIIALMRKDIKFSTISADVVDPRTGRPATATIAFSLSYEGKNPDQVQQVAATLASLYLEENLKVREQQTASASKFLDGEANELRARLASIDGYISTFKANNVEALPELLQTNMMGLDRTEYEITQTNDQIRSLKERESYLQVQLASIPTLSADQDKNLLKELKARLLQMESRLSNKHPDVIKTRAEIGELENRLSVQAGTGDNSPRMTEKPDNPVYITLSAQLASAQSDIESLKRQLGELYKKRDNYRKRIESSPKVDETYKTLMVERNNTQAKYDDLMRKSMEAKIAHGLEKGQMGERFTLIDPARLPEKPISPNKPAILLIGLILGVGAGVGTAAVRENSDQSVRSSTDLTKATGQVVLASIPEIITWGDKARIRIQRRNFSIGVVSAVAVSILLFHFFVMDLDVLWARVMRRIML